MVKCALEKISLALLTGSAYLYGALPRRIQLGLGYCLGLIVYRLRFRDAVVLKNLAYAFPNDLVQQQRIARQSYTHFGHLILEVLLLFGPMKSFIAKHVTLEGGHWMLQALEQHKGVICLASHLGNWEVMSAAGSLKIPVDLMLVTKHLKPEWLHQAVERNREKYGVHATYEPKTLKDVLSQLKKNKVVGFVLDQYVGPPVGVRVPFFGVPVGTAQVVAALAKRTGAAVIPIETFRESNGQFRVILSEPLVWISHADPNYELAQNTAYYSSVIESYIRKHPEQWLWTHRRFKGDLSSIRNRELFEGRARGSLT